MKWYRELAAYVQEHGNPHVPRTHANTKLASWVWIQRGRRYRAYSNAPLLTKEQVLLLDKLGFHWHPHDEKWEAHFEQLKRFKEQHGHFEVAIGGSADMGLVHWVQTQRRLTSEKELSRERKAKLDAIGSNWVSQANDFRWQKTYQQLKLYRSVHGHCFPSSAGGGRVLALWTSNQRKLRRQGLLSKERIRQLDLLGFNWRGRSDRAWDEWFAKLAAFKAEFGHCEVLPNVARYKRLDRFVYKMR